MSAAAPEAVGGEGAPESAPVQKLTVSDVEALRVDMSGWNQQRLGDRGRRDYITYLSEPSYSGAGLLTHDGQRVVFQPRQFDHAFKCSPDYRRDPHDKKFFDEDRISRLHWIVPLIGGRVAGSRCTLIHDSGRRPPMKQRLYSHSDLRYIVRLWQSKNSQYGQWQFETAHILRKQRIEECRGHGACIAVF